MSRYQAENTDIWEDKFRREYQAHQELKEKYNTQVELCKKLVFIRCLGSLLH